MHHLNCSKEYVGFRRNLSTTEAAHVLGWLHHVDEGSVTNVSEVHAAFIFTVEVYRVPKKSSLFSFQLECKSLTSTLHEDPHAFLHLSH